MKSWFYILFLFLSPGLIRTEIQAQNCSDSLIFSGQLISWAGINFINPGHQQLGIRYLPEISYTLQTSKNISFDIDASLNVYSNFLFTGFEYDTSVYGFRPYRLSARISSDQWEIRAGLQKISFGSATMLRPLMWFDKIDARDPLQLTDGVYGILGRYYFLDNANIWLWGLYGNKEPRGWDYLPLDEKKPEYGGRVQWPILKGEIAFSFHHRFIDMGQGYAHPPSNYFFPENKFGVDGKWDIGAGFWFEYVYKKSNTSMFITNHKEQYLNIGSDYTLLVGNGLNISSEHFLFLVKSDYWKNWKSRNFTIFSANYPLNMTDRASLMVFYNYEAKNWYRYISLQRQYDRLSLFLMIYWNPEIFNLFAGSEVSNMFTGKGIQIMLSFNH